MASISTSYGVQSSTPETMNSAQSNFALALAGAAEALGQQQYSWAQDQYATTSAMTDQAVSNYLQFAQQASGLATNAINTYENMYQPQEAAAVSQANTYASPERIAMNMGAAQSDAAQAANAARIAAESNLQGYGIDPSSGRYQELEQAQRAGGAAAAAGAGQQAMLATQNTGLQLRQQAINTGLQYPGFAVNELNAANTGISNAENATLSNVNTGVNALESANPFLSTAMSLKYPPVANQSSGQQGSSSVKQPNQPNQSSGASRTATQNPASPNYTGQTFQGAGAASPGGAGGGGSSAIPLGRPGSIASVQNFGGGQQQPNAGFACTGGACGINENQYSTINSPNDMGIYDQGGFSNSYDTANSSDPFGNATSYGNVNQGPGDSAPGIPDMSNYQESYNTACSSNPWANPTQYGSACSPSTGGVDTSGYTDVTAGNGGGDQAFSTGDQGYQNYGEACNGGFACTGGACGFAAGGGIPTRGGQVPMQASPSRGQRPDDVDAKLTPHEFVVPQDVALWKGQEYFQKLIAQSRKARMSAPAHGKPAPGPSGPPRFVSRPVGVR